MIALFDISAGKPVPSIHCHMIPQLKKIMDLYPDQYLEIYRYLFYTTCPDSTMNPYVNQPEDMREQVIIADLGPSFSLDDKVIEDTRKWCEKMYETPTLRIVLGAKAMLDEMAKKLTSPLTFGKNGNAADMRGIMKEIKGYTNDYLELENKLKEEQAKVRGAAKVPYHQRLGYVDKKKDEDDDNP